MIKRPRLPRRKPVARDTGELTRLATSLTQSCCRPEDGYWQEKLAAVVNQLLEERDEASITTALDQLFSKDIAAYGVLIDEVESHAESTRISDPQPTDVVLLAIPVLAWSRFQIPTGHISDETLTALRAQLHGHVLAKEARLSLINHLFSPDQLPQSYIETRELNERLITATLHGRIFPLDGKTLPETGQFLSDTRYVLGAVATKSGAPLFRWQEEPVSHDEVANEWCRQTYEVIRPLLPACAFEIMPPTAYHMAVRNADRASRPYSLQASIDFLGTVLARPAEAFQATVAAYHDKELEEYRIGFGFLGSNEILHGVVWPVLDPEDEAPDTMTKIESLLREFGLDRISLLPQRLPLEFCDDCGAPLFPNPEGESTHAELPADADSGFPQQLH